MNQTQDYLREFVTIMFIRKRTILGVFLLFAIGAFLIAFLWPPSYQAEGSIILKRNETLTSPESVEDVNPEVTRIQAKDLFSEMELLSSDSVAEKTANMLVQENQHFSDHYSSPRGHKKLLSKIKTNLSARIVPETNVIRVSLVWDDPDKAQDVLDLYFQEYLNFRVSLYNPKEALVFFQQQLRNFSKQLGEREQSMIEMAENANVSSPSEQIRGNIETRQNLVTQLSRLEMDLDQKREYLRHVQDSLESQKFNFFTSIDNLDIGDYGEELVGLVQEKQELREKYTDQNDRVRTMQERIDETYASLKAEVQRYINAEQSKVRGMEKSVADLKQRIADLDRRNVELYKNSIHRESLGREINLLTEYYNTFGKRLEQASIKSRSSTETLFNVGILSKPNAPQSPFFPNKRSVISLGLLLGVMVSVTMAFFLDFFDHTIKRPEDVYNYTDMPPLGSIPRW